MTRVRDLSIFLAVLGLGLIVSEIFGLGDVIAGSGYFFAVSALLAIGLLGSTTPISIDELRRNGRRVMLAITAGVVLKAVIISGILYLAFREPAYLVLGVAVAQIDPLATAADSGLSRLSARARSLLSAWASFDDPVTTLLAVYVSAIVLRATGGSGPGPDSVGAFAVTLGANLLLAGAAYLVWRLFVRRSAEPSSPRSYQLIATAVLAAVVVVSVTQFWMLSVAIAGLFFRPAFVMRLLPVATRVAFFVAAFALGITLVHGVDLAAGVVLGVSAYLAQILVGWLLTSGLRNDERVRIALGQQNGITAIILALVLEPSFPGTVGVVAPAILCINLLHAGANTLWDRLSAAPWSPRTVPPRAENTVRVEPERSAQALRRDCP